jgi:transcriptional regulator with XRE-family HTH domain
MGNRIVKRRKELLMTQEQLAEAIGVSTQSVSCIENGKKAIRAENLSKLCDVLDVSVDYILKGKKSAKQLEGIFKKFETMNEEDYQIVENIVDRLNVNNEV